MQLQEAQGIPTAHSISVIVSCPELAVIDYHISEHIHAEITMRKQFFSNLEALKRFPSKGTKSIKV